MKLYTEEQVKRAINLTLDSPTHANLVIDHLTPIELPSDEEVENESTHYIQSGYSNIFIKGAKWMRDKILNK